MIWVIVVVNVMIVIILGGKQRHILLRRLRTILCRPRTKSQFVGFAQYKKKGEKGTIKVTEQAVGWLLV